MFINEEMFLQCEVRDTDIPSRLKHVLFRHLDGFDFKYKSMILPVEDITEAHNNQYIKVEGKSSVGINHECHVGIYGKNYMVDSIDLIG